MLNLVTVPTPPRRAIVLACMASLLSIGAPALAQAQMGGMGGMGGRRGGMGGMSGGVGRGGMRGGPRGGGGRTSPTDLVRQRLKQGNTLAFLLDHKKRLALTGLQQDSIKGYRKEVEHLQKPLFSLLDDVLGDGRTRGQRGDRGMPGGVGRDLGGEEEGRGAGMDRFLPDTARALVARLEDIQQSFGDRARGLLDKTQQQRADSIQRSLFDAQRAKLREQMERRRRG